MKMCHDDSDKLALLAKLQELDPQLLEAVPEDQQQWLLASLWNRGCSHVKFGRPMQAVQLMRAALQVQSWHIRDADQQQVLSRPGKAGEGSLQFPWALHACTKCADAAHRPLRLAGAWCLLCTRHLPGTAATDRFVHAAAG